MKKQIFILLVALFAVTSVFGQKNPTAAVSAAPNCGTSDAYHPAAGVPSTYSVKIEGTGYNGDGTYTWLVTDNTDLLGASTVAATEWTKTSGGGATDDNIVITWDASSIGKTYYVVVNYQEQNSTNTACTINNVKVFPVQPRNTFWLAIDASTDGTTVATTYDVCAPNVSSAKITTPGDISVAKVEYEYGTTTLYAIIHAAGYTGNFDATLKVSGLVTNQVASIAGWTGGTAPIGNGTYTSTQASTYAGVDIPVTIVITNNQHELLVDQPITISVDGSFTSNGVTLDDLSDENGACTPEDPDADYVIQTVKARPTITPVSPAGFVSDPTTLP